jgi:DNA-binding transcriptional ArsR family regulator
MRFFDRLRGRKANAQTPEWARDATPARRTAPESTGSSQSQRIEDTPGGSERGFEADGFSFFRDNNREWRWSREVSAAEMALGATVRSFPFGTLADCVANARAQGYKGPDTAPPEAPRPDVEALTKSEDVDGLIKALAHEDDTIRGRAADRLGRLGDPRAVDPLIAALGDDAPSVRTYAASALYEFGDARAVEPLIAVLQDDWAGPRYCAADSLGQFGDRRAVEPLIALLRDEDWQTRQSAARSLGKLADERAREPLAAALDDPDERVYMVVAESLANLRDARAVDTLVRALERQGYWARFAVKPLERIGGPEAERALAEHHARGH